MAPRNRRRQACLQTTASPVNDSNHRYMTSDAIYDQMFASGWSAEAPFLRTPITIQRGEQHEQCHHSAHACRRALHAAIASMATIASAAMPPTSAGSLDPTFGTGGA